jgi:hypothetical protein
MRRPGTDARETIGRSRLSPIEQLGRFVFKERADGTVVDFERQDATRLETQRATQSRCGVDRPFIRCTSRQYEDNFATPDRQGQAFFITRITVAAFAEERGLDVHTAHGGSHPPASNYRLRRE